MSSYKRAEHGGVKSSNKKRKVLVQNFNRCRSFCDAFPETSRVKNCKVECNGASMLYLKDDFVVMHLDVARSGRPRIRKR
jgi:hypothetical protein